MSRRTVYILAGVLGVLVALIAVSRWSLARPSLPQKPPADLAAITEAKSQRVVISVGGASVELANEGGAWTIETSGAAAATATAAPGKTKPGRTATSAAAGKITPGVSTTADPAKVKELFDVIAGSSFERLVAKQATDPAAFGLDDKTATRLRVTGASGVLADLLIGADTDVPDTYYVRAAGASEVWALSGGLRTVLTPTREGWIPAPSLGATGSPAPGAPSGLPGLPGLPGADPTKP